MLKITVNTGQSTHDLGHIICLGQNYKRHAKEMGSEPPDIPYFFYKPLSSVIFPGRKIVLPPMSKKVHHEVELGILIGKQGKDILPENALEHIDGYCIVLDITARDLQSKAKQRRGPFDIAKSFDTFAPLSDFVPSSSVSDPNSLPLKLWVNGELRQDSNTSDMIFNVQEQISFLSQILTLNPGDLIATGTPEGVGEIVDGDVITAEIEGIGRIEYPVVRK